ncbi:MAG: hypothetical protein E5Y79_27865 [Mesorhizobium sp.]|nr:MAG: hypothetical protein E5Y79_27865 [Mesorhizobium sp.]
MPPPESSLTGGHAGGRGCANSGRSDEQTWKAANDPIALAASAGSVSGCYCDVDAKEVAVYTEHWHHVAVVRKVLLRMSSWPDQLRSNFPREGRHESDRDIPAKVAIFGGVRHGRAGIGVAGGNRQRLDGAGAANFDRAGGG